MEALYKFKVVKIFQSRLTAIKFYKKKEMIKIVRAKLGLIKSPKRKGYAQLFTEEERRYTFFYCIHFF